MSTILISRNREGAFSRPDQGKKISNRRFAITFISLQGVSVLLHIGLMLILFFMQQHTFSSRKMPPSLQVDLVTYTPKLEDLLKSESKQPKKDATKKVEKRIKPKPVKKKKIKKKVVDVNPESVKTEEKKPVEKKISEPVQAEKEDDKAEEIEELEQEKIRDLLDEMREKVAEQEKLKDLLEGDEAEEEGSQGLSRGRWSNITAESIYQGIFSTMIQKKWVFNERLAKLDRNDKQIKVLVMIKILSNGELGDIWIETKSGNAFLDKSAVRAIKKAAPFPPLPKEFQRHTYEIGLRFSPKGLH